MCYLWLAFTHISQSRQNENTTRISGRSDWCLVRFRQYRYVIYILRDAYQVTRGMTQAEAMMMTKYMQRRDMEREFDKMVKDYLVKLLQGRIDHAIRESNIG